MAYPSTFAKAMTPRSAAIDRSKQSAEPPSPSKSTTLLNGDPMSPTKRTARWLERSAPVKDAALHNVRGAKITKPGQTKHKKRSSFWGLPLLASLFGNSKATGGNNLDGDTFINSDDGVEATQHDNDLTLVTDGDYYQELQDDDKGRTLKNYGRNHLADYDDPQLAEWTDEETWFFARLRSRGREPLFDRTWFMDFPWFPDRVFTHDQSQVLINNKHCTIYRGTSRVH